MSGTGTLRFTTGTTPYVALYRCGSMSTPFSHYLLSNQTHRMRRQAAGLAILSTVDRTDTRAIRI